MTVDLLFKRLTGSPVEYIAHSIIGEDTAVVKFTGEFEGAPIIWNATIVALNARSAQSEAQYIEIATVEHHGENSLTIEIGLFVTKIDEPTVIKVIKMIRQYKNLSRGRHEFSGANK